MTKPSERLKALCLTLPPVTKPVGAYVPALRFGDRLLLSGQIPLKDGKVVYTGKVGGPSGRTYVVGLALRKDSGVAFCDPAT